MTGCSASSFLRSRIRTSYPDVDRSRQPTTKARSMTDEVDIDTVHHAMHELRDAAMPLHNKTVSAEMLIQSLGMPVVFTLIDAEKRNGDRFYVSWPPIEFDERDEERIDSIWWMMVQIQHLAPNGRRREARMAQLDRLDNARVLLQMTEDSPGAAHRLLATLRDATRWVKHWGKAAADSGMAGSKSR
jgi:hypothetical protein